jgi:hypothetical protein
MYISKLAMKYSIAVLTLNHIVLPATRFRSLLLCVMICAEVCYLYAAPPVNLYSVNCGAYILRATLSVTLRAALRITLRGGALFAMLRAVFCV